jgi:hypothetical protein
MMTAIRLSKRLSNVNIFSVKRICNKKCLFPTVKKNPSLFLIFAAAQAERKKNFQYLKGSEEERRDGVLGDQISVRKLTRSVKVET